MNQLLLTSFIMSIIILFVLIHRKYKGHQFSSKIYYIIWMIISIRLILPFDLTIGTPIYNFTNRTTFTNQVEQNELKSTIITEIDENELVLNDKGEFEKVEESPGRVEKVNVLSLIRKHLFKIWLLGAIIYAVSNLLVYISFKCKVTGNLSFVDKGIEEKFHKIRFNMAPNSKIIIRQSDFIDSPLLIGIFKPMLLIPRNIAYKNIDYIIHHELVHLKKRDLIYKLIISAAVVIHWFNPMVHLMGKNSFMDLEFACDEEVVKDMKRAERGKYCKVLIETISSSKKDPILIINYGGGKKMIKNRIDNILDNMKKDSGKYVVSALLIIVMSSVLFIGCESKAVINIDDLTLQAKESTEEEGSYYLKAEMKKYNKDIIMDEMIWEEWYRYSPEKGYDRKIVANSNDESFINISNNNGFIMHDLIKNKGEILDKENINKEIPDAIDALNMKSTKENTRRYIEDLSENFTLDVVGEDKVNGWDTIHIVCQPIGLKEVLGEEEIWIEKDTWIITKQVKRINNMLIEMNIIELNTKHEIDDNIFKYELPDGVKVYNLGN